MMDTSPLDKLLDQADALLAEGDHARAVPLLQQATERDPKSFTAWLRLGVALHGQEDDERAVRAFESALKWGETAELWSQYGEALIAVGEFEDGRRALRRASSLGGGSLPLFHVACSFEREGRRREALDALCEYLRRAPDDPDGWEFLEVLGADPAMAEEAVAFRFAHCDAAMEDLLASRRRLLEGAEGFPLDLPGGEAGVINLKSEFARRLGRVLTGSADDDGVIVPPYGAVRLGVDHLGVTLARLLAVLEVFHVEVGRVHPVDPESRPLAAVMADLLGVTLAEDAAGLDPQGGTTLVFQALGRDFLRFARARAAVPAPQVTFVAALAWIEQGLTFEPSHVPDVTGVVGSALSLPPPEELASEPFLGFLRGAIAKHRANERERQVAFHAGRRHAFHFPGLDRA
jgi:tetratricopeptide (TPR) repeat protein